MCSSGEYGYIQPQKEGVPSRPPVKYMGVVEKGSIDVGVSNKERDISPPIQSIKNP